MDHPGWRSEHVHHRGSDLLRGQTDLVGPVPQPSREGIGPITELVGVPDQPGTTRLTRTASAASSLRAPSESTCTAAFDAA